MVIITDSHWVTVRDKIRAFKKIKEAIFIPILYFDEKRHLNDEIIGMTSKRSLPLLLFSSSAIYGAKSDDRFRRLRWLFERQL